MAASIQAQLQDDRMRRLIDDLRELGLSFSEAGPAPAQGPLAGKTLVLTGTLPDADPRAGHRAHQAAGGRVTGSVSKKTDYVVAGDSSGLEAREGRAAASSRCSTRPVCWQAA